MKESAWKEYVRIAIRRILRMGLRVMWVFPVKKNRILFQSHDRGQGYSCSPKYVCEYLKKHYPDKYELVWAFQEPEKYQDIAGILPVKLYSLRWLYYFATAKVFVMNVGIRSFMPKRNNQFLVETWHGHPYKRIGFSRTDMTKSKTWARMQTTKAIGLFVGSSEVCTEIVIKDSFHYSGEIMKCGMPRNDILLDPLWREKTAETVKAKLKLTGYVVLFAPTFRNDGAGISAKEMMPYQHVIAALQKRTGNKVTFLVRSHHWDKGTRIEGSDLIDVSDYPDIQELYCAADMMITDYSSCMWDYALLKRPCLLYMPDLEEYCENDRGFYFPIEKMPGLICRNEKELLQTIATFDESECAKIAEKHLRENGSWESGTASRQVSERIVSIIG